MHIPPFYKRRHWQVFLLGCIIGSIISYGLFLFMYGKMYQSLYVEHAKISSELQDVTRQNEALKKDNEQLESTDYVIESIHIRFSPNKKLRLNRLQLVTLENMMKEELEEIIGKSVRSIAENDDILIAMLENKRFTIGDDSFQCTTKKLFITDKVEWTVLVEHASS